jgi:hypothetical protein
MSNRSHRFQRPRKSEEPQLKLIRHREPRRRDSDDTLASARCPICGHALIARQDCHGPYFFCLCVKQKAA